MTSVPGVPGFPETPTSPQGRSVAAVRALHEKQEQHQQEIKNALEGAMAEIKNKLEVAVADIQTKAGNALNQVHEVTEGMKPKIHEMKENGKEIIDNVEKQKAETITKVMSLQGETYSEFNKHKQVITDLANQVNNAKQDIVKLTSGLHEEMPLIKGQIASLQSEVTRQAADPTTVTGMLEAVRMGMKQEFDAIRSEMDDLKSESARRSTAGRPVDSGGGKRGGFTPWKNMTPKNFGSKEEQ